MPHSGIVFTRFEYPQELDSVVKMLHGHAPLVFAGEARKLEERLGEAAMGNVFLLQGGDCAESFKELNAHNIQDTFRVLLQMAVVLMFGGQVPVVKKHDLLWKTWGHGSLKVKVSGNWWNSYPLALIYLSGRNSMICKETINPRV